MNKGTKESMQDVAMGMLLVAAAVFQAFKGLCLSAALMALCGEALVGLGVYRVHRLRGMGVTMEGKR